MARTLIQARMTPIQTAAPPGPLCAMFQNVIATLPNEKMARHTAEARLCDLRNQKANPANRIASTNELRRRSNASPPMRAATKKKALDASRMIFAACPAVTSASVHPPFVAPMVRHQKYGGRGIRTPGTVSRTMLFKTCGLRTQPFYNSNPNYSVNRNLVEQPDFLRLRFRLRPAPNYRLTAAQDSAWS